MNSNLVPKRKAWAIITFCFCLPTLVLLMAAVTSIDLTGNVRGILSGSERWIECKRQWLHRYCS